MTSLLLAFVAGLLTTVNPCVLPMLPLVLTGAFAQGRWGPVSLAAGLVLSFTVFGVALTAFGHLIGLDQNTFRYIAAALLLLSGLVLVHGPTQALFARMTTPLAGGANATLDRMSLQGNRGQFLLGTLLGAVWTPCVGPTLGAAIAVASQGENLGYTTLVMAIFGLGMASVFLAIAYASRGVMGKRREKLAGFGAGSRKVFGWLLVAVGIMIISGLDKTLETFLIGVMPDWLLELTTRF